MGGGRPKAKGRKLENVAPRAVNYDNSTPRFCLRHLVKDYDVDAIGADARAALALALAKRARLTWSEIKRAPRHGLGTEWMPRAQLQASIPTAFEDQDRFMVFRYHGKLPMVGVRVDDTFHILWIEPNFGDLYDHG